jgi:SpoIID/LytB domain protein
MNKSSKSILSAVFSACLLGGSLGAARAAEVVQVPAGFTITGSGFGHGVGMSQYGAQGMGLAGKTASQILTHYYKGTTVDAVEMADAKIRVGLLQDRAFVAVRGERIPDLSSGGAFNVVIDTSAPIAVASGIVATFTTVDETTQVTVDGVVRGSGSKIVLNWNKADTVINVGSGTSASAAVNNPDPKITSDLGTATCTPNACPHRYRYGTLEITSGFFGDSIMDLVVVNTLRLSDEYLYGLGEVPSSWTPAAMQAQAIAGRSYAIMKKTNRLACSCQIYSSTLDQAFVGYSKEIEKVGSNNVGKDGWVAAVNATIKGSKAYVVRHNGSVISTYYSSSTGGKSQPTTEVWGASLPYAVSVDDPWSLDPRVNNRNTSWTSTVDQATLVARLRAQGVMVPDVWSISVTGKYRSGGISELNISDSAGNITTLTIAPRQPVTPDELRGLLGTKSTYISAIKPGIETVPGSTSATAKKLKSVTKVNWPKKSIKPSNYNFKGTVSPAQVGATVKLQRKSGSKWKTVSTATTNSKGAWSIPWTGPNAGKHDLRITATNSKGTVKTTTKRVNIAGSIGISAPKSAKRNASFVVSGSVKPGYESMTVVLQRKVGNGSWKSIAQLKTDANGKWSSKRYAGSKKSTVSYRVKIDDSRVGKLTSKVQKTAIK